MEPTEKRVVIVLADISGYTQFMVENQMSAVHGQQCITFLIETLIREIDIPLRLQEIEGDALFLYAEDPGTDEAWQDALEQIPAKLLRFFDAFYEGAVLAMEATPCKCAICRNSRWHTPLPGTGPKPEPPGMASSGCCQTHRAR